MRDTWFAKLDSTSAVDLSDEIVRGISGGMTDSELDGVSGGQELVFTDAEGLTITASSSCSCGRYDDCCD